MLEDLEAIEHKCLIRYEDLAGAPAGVLGTVLDFLGLERLDGSALDGQWRIHESQAEIQNMNARSLAALSGEERLIIEREAGTLLMTLGYSEKA